MGFWEKIVEQTWYRAWMAMADHCGLDLDPHSLSMLERWSVVAAILRAAFGHRRQRARRWLLARAPTWIVAQRLQRRTHGWHRVPTSAAAEHVRLRFDIWPIEIGDHVRIQTGRLTAVGYATPTFSEIIFVLPNGELEPDPASAEIARAWVAYRSSARG